MLDHLLRELLLHANCDIHRMQHHMSEHGIGQQTEDGKERPRIVPEQSFREMESDSKAGYEEQYGGPEQRPRGCQHRDMIDFRSIIGICHCRENECEASKEGRNRMSNVDDESELLFTPRHEFGTYQGQRRLS